MIETVEYLTRRRRVFRTRVGLLAVIACLGTLLAVAPVHADEQQVWHDVADIAQTAEAFVLDRAAGSNGRTSAKAAALDPRLRLAACDTPLSASLRPGARVGPRTVVSVACEGARPWRVFVPVEVAVRSQVWTARHPLPRGHLLTAEDLVADERDVSRMNSGYVSDVNMLIGQRLKSSVLAGRALTLQLVEADKLIRRGQSVTLAANAGGVEIRMTGTALMDGAMGQRIRVENVNSGRVVEGIVRSREVVEVLVPSRSGLITSNR
ncbi:MAG: flagellar basal body P-ring formation chaperone FlgA [Woeseiaceae bacterium]|nr:flagellar basal body P-ring formation chaperone FlgA [Woeseiaceae bacterium]